MSRLVLSETVKLNNWEQYSIIVSFYSTKIRLSYCEQVNAGSDYKA